MRAVIIDDEVDARKSVRYFLQQYLPACIVIGEADGVKSGLEIISSNNPSVVFLDINMRDGSGFDLLNKIPERNFQLVFVTGYDEFAIKAFKYSAIDYILKPIDVDDFMLLAEKLQKTFEKDDLEEQVAILEEQMESQSFTKIALPDKDGTRYYDIDKIINLESSGNYTIVEIIDQTKVVVTRLIKDFEELLDPNLFFRTHRSHLINIKHISGFNSKNDFVVLSSGKEVPVSRRRKKELKERLGLT